VKGTLGAPSVSVCEGLTKRKKASQLAWHDIEWDGRVVFEGGPILWVKRVRKTNRVKPNRGTIQQGSDSGSSFRGDLLHTRAA
jgi:hypothetical protein